MRQMEKILKVNNALDILMVFFHLFIKIYRMKKSCIPHDRVKGRKNTPELEIRSHYGAIGSPIFVRFRKVNMF